MHIRKRPPNLRRLRPTGRGVGEKRASIYKEILSIPEPASPNKYNEVWPFSGGNKIKNAERTQLPQWLQVFFFGECLQDRGFKGWPRFGNFTNRFCSNAFMTLLRGAAERLNNLAAPAENNLRAWMLLASTQELPRWPDTANQPQVLAAQINPQCEARC
ncbi:MAG: hypothetical protein ACREQI_14525 [Candidatus Binataceae bacterium]